MGFHVELYQQQKWLAYLKKNIIDKELIVILSRIIVLISEYLLYLEITTILTKLVFLKPGLSH